MTDQDKQLIDFAIWLAKNNYVSNRGNIWVDTNIGAENKIYAISELLEVFKSECFKSVL
jgi:hypothetical protein